MEASNVIKVWEHSTLEVGEVFSPVHFAALRAYLTDNPDCGFYSLLDNAVRFCQYVGAIQVGDLCIEVLPKTDQHSDGLDTWQKILVEMIFISHRIPVSISTEASLTRHRGSVLETYLQMFLSETEQLLHEGLTKKYRTEESNKNALKGRLIFRQHLKHNLIHNERFYSAHVTYDQNNVFNSILKQTLELIANLPGSPTSAANAKSALWHFPECTAIEITDKLFRTLSYDRKTARYKKAVAIAEIILRQYHPDVRSGHHSILAVMFDMNRLWEAFIYDTLVDAARGIPGTEIEEKPSADFYISADTENHSLEPDIVVTLPNQSKVIIDTKWKYNRRTSIADLRQMYTYGHYFEAERSFLVYPFCNPAHPLTKAGGHFSENSRVLAESQSCGLMFVDLVQEGRLNRRIGEAIITAIGNE